MLQPIKSLFLSALIYRCIGLCSFDTHQSPQTRRSSLWFNRRYWTLHIVQLQHVVSSSSVTSSYQLQKSASPAYRSSADHQRQYEPRSVQNNMVLEKRLLPNLNEWASRTGFSGTGDRICMMVLHVIKEDQLSSFLLEFETLPWSGNSLDLNPVKKLWGYLEVRNEKGLTIANKQNLIEELISVWARNDKIRNDCVELVHAMPTCVVALHEVKGSFTKYTYSTVYCILY